MKRSISILGYCLDIRVLVAITLVAVGVLVIAPGLLWAALPVLAILACPLSMLLMMRCMGKMNGQPSLPSAEAKPLSREEQLRDLQDQLAGVQSQQAAIASQIQHLSREQPPVTQGAGGLVSRN